MNQIDRPKFLHVFLSAVGSRCITVIALIGCISAAQAQSYIFTTLAGANGIGGSSDGIGSAARFLNPRGVAVDGAGNVYVADTGSNTIRKITSAGVVTTLAGTPTQAGSTNGPGTTASFYGPQGVAVDVAGNVFVTEDYHTIRRVTTAGLVSSLAGSPAINGSVDGVGSVARFNVPSGVAVDAAGNVYVADSRNHTIRKISSGGVVTTLAGLPGSDGSTDGIGGTGRFFLPSGVAVDVAGTIYVADFGNHTIRKISTDGAVTTVAGSPTRSGAADGNGSAARFHFPSGLAVDAAGKLYVADQGNHTIRTIATDGTVTTIAGVAGVSGAINGSGSAARFLLPTDVALDLTGNLYVAESFSQTIRKGTLETSSPSITSSRIAGFAIRSQAGAGAQTLIVGFNISGVGTVGTKPILLRGVGPGLTQFGVPGILADPKLELFSGANKINENDDWAGNAQVAAVGGQVGAFVLGSSSSKDAALYNATFSPGGYSVWITGNGSATGVALAEIYDATPASTYTATTPRLTNVSARTQVGTGGDILIAGFTISGQTSKTVLIRAIGPTLDVFGVPGTLADPKLELFAGATRINQNDNWGGSATLANAFLSVGAFPLQGTTRDAALLVTLAPGSYTAQVSGVGSTTGVALVEVYEVP